MAARDSQLSLAFRRDDSHAPGLSEDARPEDSRQRSDWAVHVRRLERVYIEFMNELDTLTTSSVSKFYFPCWFEMV